MNSSFQADCAQQKIGVSCKGRGEWIEVSATDLHSSYTRVSMPQKRIKTLSGYPVITVVPSQTYFDENTCHVHLLPQPGSVSPSAACSPPASENLELLVKNAGF